MHCHSTAPALGLALPRYLPCRCPGTASAVPQPLPARRRDRFEIDQLMCCQDRAGLAPGQTQTCGDVFYNGTFQNGQHAVTFQPEFAANYAGSTARVGATPSAAPTLT